MTIGTNGVDSGANASNAANSITGNGDMTQLFTRLLIAQIKNQNPLEPTDPSQFVSQLTQLSQVESMQQLVAQTNASADAPEHASDGARCASRFGCDGSDGPSRHW